MEEGNGPSLQNVVFFFCFLEYRMMDKTRNPAILGVIYHPQNPLFVYSYYHYHSLHGLVASQILWPVQKGNKYFLAPCCGSSLQLAAKTNLFF
jgi:hypothetical protein